ncbi:PTS system, mannitol-specific IIA component [Spiroplasma gladiatoris]|uniref:Mannitol-specific phosphotransferase enzyme IIA component n=1 Tax=Spiroplasma gladiatoris TaxID=2143 RepID=A0A4P7AGG5_9MOLU|nr:PTS sugar transporter subunit IIA [Spiroplasma gladiatoris]QBQ07465.1 PTS system, mannitol-specific IIA component [Spiroplasma gladiatoris]
MKLKEENIFLNIDLKNKEEVFEFLEEKLISLNLGNKEFIESMKSRDKKASVALGNYLALPHCEYEFSKKIKKSNLIIIKLKEKLIWDGSEILFVICLISSNDEQMDILANIGISFSDDDEVLNLFNTVKDAKQIIEFIEEED